MSESALAIGGDTILRLLGDASPAALLSPPKTPGLVAPSRSLRGRVLLTLALLLAVGAAGRFGWHWWTNGRFEEATDNAYLQADKVVVAPKVGGFVAEVFAGDNQPHRNAFRLVMMAVMQQVHDSNSRAKTYSGPGSLSGHTTRHERPHDGIDFAETLVQATLRSDGVGGYQSGQDADIHFVLDRPEMLLAGRIGKRKAVNREILRLHRRAQ